MIPSKLVITTVAMSMLLLAGCNTSVVTKNYTIQGYNNDAIMLITSTSKVGGFNSFYASGGLKSQEYKQQLNDEGKKNCTVINGTYFGTTTGGGFQPAGELVFYNGLDNENIITSTINPVEDQNLGIHVAYKSTNNQISFNEDKIPVRGVSFFAGPMIVQDGVLNTKIRQDISHRNSPYPRTFMIQLANHTTVLGISKQKTTLSDLGEQLNKIFKEQIISVVNLDGGPSTSLENDRISFNTETKLPLWFSICEKE